MSQSNNTSLGNKGQTWGVIDGETLRIIKTSENHFVKKYRGYGVSPETISQAQAEGATWLELVGYDGEQFRLRIADYVTYAIPDDLGAGRQLFMSVKSMKWYMQRDATVNLEADILKDRRERQMRMFG